MIKICRECGAKIPAKEWLAHRQAHRNAEKPSTVEKGYGAEHRRLRKQWEVRVAAGGVRCSRCNEPILPGEPFDLDHDQDRSGYLGASHEWCNAATSSHRVSVR
jgi:hypothetical protein